MPSKKHDPNQTTADSQPASVQADDSDIVPRRPLGPETRLADRYRIVRLLGQGGTGSVYEALDEARSGWRVAIKLLTVHQPQAIYRLKNEFRVLSETVHPNLVGLHGLSGDARGWFVIMDLVDPSTDFRSYVRGSADTFDELRLRSGFVQLVRGVAAIHAAGKLHRDLKPSNVLVTREGRVVIVDFGLVGDQDPGGTGSTVEGWFAGTPAYAAPEQGAGLGIGPKVDLYALGVLLFETLTGRLPFDDDSMTRVLEQKQLEDAPDPRSLADDLPSDLCALCSALLRRDPSLRPDVHELLAQLEQGPVAPATVTSLPFVGRERELALLERAASEARAGSPLLTLIRGEPGIGKTALAARFLALMRAEPRVIVLQGRCHVQEQVPYNAFDLLVDALGRYLSRLPPVEAASLMPRDAALLARLFPTLARVPIVRSMPAAPSRELGAALLRPRAFAALKELLARIADRSLLILAIDDLQWGDDDSAELLRELLRGPDLPACLFVCTFRSAEATASRAVAEMRAAEGWSVLELDLVPLDAAAASELAQATLGSAPSAAELQLLVDEAAGSPFLIKELASAARSRGRVGSLPDAVVAHSEALDEQARALLELVCIAGEPLDLNLAMRAAGALPPALPSVLASSLLRNSAREGREYLESSHDRVREAVLEALPTERKRALHAALAHELARDALADPERIAQHHRAAGQAAEAAPYLVQAAQRAWDALALGRAAELYELALAVAPDEQRTTLERSLADVYASAGRASEAAERYRHLLSSTLDPEQRRRITSNAMLLSLLAGHIERGMELADQLCAQLAIRPPPRNTLLFYLARALLMVRYLVGRRVSELPVPTKRVDPPIAAERLEFYLRASRGMLHASPDHGTYYGWRALVTARRSRDAQAWPLVIVGEVVWRAVWRGVARPEELETIDRAVKLAEAQGDAEKLSVVLGAQGGCALFTCRIAEAQAAFQRADEVIASCTRPIIQDMAGPHNGRLAAYNLAGELTELLAQGRRRITEARALGDRFGEVTARAIVAQGMIALDDPAAAWEQINHLDSALLDATLLGADSGWRGDIALYEGNFEGAFREHERACRSPFFRSMQRVSAHRTYCSLLLARASLMAARAHGGARHLRTAQREQRSMQREGFATGPAGAAQIRAGLAALRGDQETALQELVRAAEIYERCGTFLYAAASRYYAGKLLQGEQGRQWVTQARSDALRMGATNPERMFRSLAPGLEKD